MSIRDRLATYSKQNFQLIEGKNLNFFSFYV